MGERLEIVLVEDEQLLRELLERTLSQVPGIIVTGAFGKAEDALAWIEQRPPDAVLSDINLGPGMDGITLARAVRKRWPAIAVTILSHHADMIYVDALRRALGHGWAYMLKKSALSVDSLERCLRSVAGGLVVLDPEIVASAQAKPGKPQLTGRSAEIWCYIAQGYSNAALMQKYGITERSVERLVSQIYLDLDIDVENTAANPRVLAALAFLGEPPR